MVSAMPATGVLVSALAGSGPAGAPAAMSLAGPAGQASGHVGGHASGKPGELSAAGQDAAPGRHVAPTFPSTSCVASEGDKYQARHAKPLQSYLDPLRDV